MVNVVELKIKTCKGCAVCLTKGICPMKDDVKGLQDKMIEADGIVTASPLFLNHISGLLKIFLDRCLPIGHRPVLHGKVAASVASYGGVGNVELIGDYLLEFMQGSGARPVGEIHAIGLDGKLSEQEQKNAVQLAADMLEDYKNLDSYDWHSDYMSRENARGMKEFINNTKDFATADYDFWKEKGWID
jgi:multimeric flavodoxin WrbA